MKSKQTLSLFILLSMFCTAMLISCNKDDNVIVQTMAQQNAEKILSYGVDKVNIIFPTEYFLNGTYPLTIENYFLVIKTDSNTSYLLPLENITYMTFTQPYNTLSIHFTW